MSNNDTIYSTPVKVPAIPSQTQNMLSLVTDPYHDFNMRAQGYPDGLSTVSAVQRHYGATTVQCPFTLAAGETWSFHIYTTALHQINTFDTGTWVSGNLTAYANNQITMGPIMIQYIKYQSDGSIAMQQFKTLPAQGALTQANYGSKYRYVSFGFELHNTTAALYRSGSLTVYRANEQYEPYYGYIQRASGAAFDDYSTLVVGSYPRNIDDAYRYPNTRTWEAEKGAYCVALPFPNNNFGRADGSNIMIKNYDGAGGMAMYRRVGGTNPLSLSASPLANVGVISSRFSDNEQTFTLDFRSVIEIAPDMTDTQTLMFATTSPSVDRAFLKLYKGMFNNIPPGVPVGFNDAGEWFRRILQIAKAVAPTILPFLPPQVRTVATIALPAITAAGEVLLKKKEEKVPKQSKANKTNRMLPAKKQ